MKITTDVIISINVHEKPDFLLKQYENIKKYLKLNYIIILNCNDYMYSELKDKKEFKDIILNPDFINKKTFTGTLLKGIYSNLELALNKYEFKYFLVLSSRNIFYNELTLEKCKKLKKKIGGYKIIDKYNNWHWPSFLQTKLGKYMIKNNWLLSCSAHEGLMLDINLCNVIINFFKKNNFKENLFKWNHATEEFALQCICINTKGYYYDIGNGVEEHLNSYVLPNDRYVYKIERK